MAKKPESERFMSHVIKDEAGCWLWTAFKMPSGYGNFRTPQRHELAHRASYRLFVGPLIDGLEVMHSCDNPSCVNPEHLSLGTRLQNMTDAKNKGRVVRGGKHGRAKIDQEDVDWIRASKRPQSIIAALVGISQTQVSRIRSGHKWAAGPQGEYHRE